MKRRRGARYLSADLGRWLSVDPLADMYPDLSSYNYVDKNPLIFVDTDGRDFGNYYDSNGNFIGNDGIEDEKEYVAKTNQASAVKTDLMNKNVKSAK